MKSFASYNIIPVSFIRLAYQKQAMTNNLHIHMDFQLQKSLIDYKRVGHESVFSCSAAQLLKHTKNQSIWNFTVHIFTAR